jgi:hypothetical protein
VLDLTKPAVREAIYAGGKTPIEFYESPTAEDYDGPACDGQLNWKEGSSLCERAFNYCSERAQYCGHTCSALTETMKYQLCMECRVATSLRSRLTVNTSAMASKLAP